MNKMTFFIMSCILIIACDTTELLENSEERWWTVADKQLVIAELNRTTNELKLEIEKIREGQWDFRENPSRWSIGEIVEHLEMQNQLHYREISVISKAPQNLQFRSITKGKDAFFSNYSTDPTKSKAKWFLDPIGKFCSIEDGQAAFFKARKELTQLVETTEVDFRKQYTFRTSMEGKELANIKIGQVRDLHQLLLTGIAHTDRHLHQIRKIKQHLEYPK